jgi:hypothetical protein
MPAEANRVCDAASVDAATTSALVEQATKRAGLIWVRREGDHQPPSPLWHIWLDGRAYVLGGGIEQPLPSGLDASSVSAGTRAEVTVASKDNGSRLTVWLADVAVVPPDSDEWAAAVPTLLAKRLNSPDGDAALARWARDSTVLSLTPPAKTM